MSIWMDIVRRHPLALALVAAVVVAVGGFGSFAVPRHLVHDTGSRSSPAAPMRGSAGWVWPDGVPGRQTGDAIESSVQPVELQAAELTAARAGLDASAVRVVSETRPNAKGVLAILAAPTLDRTPATTCLAALLQRGAPVVWRCPGSARPRPDLAAHRVFAAAAVFRRPGGKRALYLVGVARGDVYRVDLIDPGLETRTLYARGGTWGQFQAAVELPRRRASLRIVTGGGAVAKFALPVRPASASSSANRGGGHL